MADIKFEMSLKQIPEFVESLKKVTQEKKGKFLQDVRDQILKSVQQNFNSAGRYSDEKDIIGGGKKWKRLSRSYLEWKRRAMAGKIKHRKGSSSIKVISLAIGTRTGALRKSIQGQINEKQDNIIIGSDVSYAQYFDRRRPFLVVQRSDIQFIKRRAMDYMKKNISDARKNKR